MKGFLIKPFAKRTTIPTAVPVPPRIPIKNAASRLSIKWFKNLQLMNLEFRELTGFI